MAINTQYSPTIKLADIWICECNTIHMLLFYNQSFVRFCFHHRKWVTQHTRTNDGDIIVYWRWWWVCHANNRIITKPLNKSTNDRKIKKKNRHAHGFNSMLLIILLFWLRWARSVGRLVGRSFGRTHGRWLWLLKWSEHIKIGNIDNRPYDSFTM